MACRCNEALSLAVAIGLQSVAAEPPSVRFWGMRLTTVCQFAKPIGARYQPILNATPRRALSFRLLD